LNAFTEITVQARGAIGTQDALGMIADGFWRLTSAAVDPGIGILPVLPGAASATDEDCCNAEEESQTVAA